MTHPATVEGLEEGSVGEGNHRWVVCTEQILEPKPITPLRGEGPASIPVTTLVQTIT